MKKEFETQVLDIDARKIKNKLRDLGAKETPETLQKRWVFDIQCLSEKRTSTGEWIRLRKVGKTSTITYKNKRGARVSDTEEIEVEVNDFDKTADILSKLKCFTGQYYQENKRSKFKLSSLEFTLDTWPRIPTILEVEGKGEKDVKRGLKLLELEGKDAGHIGLIEYIRNTELICTNSKKLNSDYEKHNLPFDGNVIQTS